MFINPWDEVRTLKKEIERLQEENKLLKELERKTQTKEAKKIEELNSLFEYNGEAKKGAEK